MREMKDSGIEWIGEMPKEWNIMPNKYIMRKKKVICPIYNNEDIISLSMNGVIVRDLDAGGKMPTSFDGYQYIENGNLLMCLFDIDVTPRCIGLIKIDGLTSPAYSQFVMNDLASAEYYNYYYTMLDNDKTLVHLAKNLRHSLTEEQLGMISTIVPPLPEQQKIADFLDRKCAEIDSLVSDIQRQIEILEEYKRSVITEAVTKGLDKNAPLKDSGIEWIGDIPDKWIVIKFKYTHNGSNVGEAIDKEYWSNDNNETVFYTAGIRPIHSTYKQFPTWKYTNTDDILLARNGTPYVYFPFINAIYTDHIIRVSVNIKYDKKYIGYCLQQSILSEVVDTVSIATWSVSLWDKQYLPIPPLPEQQKIADYLDRKCAEIDNVISEKKQQLETLEEYKKSLIFEYVTGKKEVTQI